MTAAPPFHVGQRLRQADLVGWTYTGLTGTPDVDPAAVRRFSKGDWILELRAYGNRNRASSVMSIRTIEQDRHWWQQARRNAG